MGVCVVENLSRVFLSEWPFLHLWVMKVYILWVKGKKSLLKILQAECFATVLWEGLTCETLAKTTTWHDSSTSSHVLFTWFFHDLASRKLLAKSIDSSFKLESSPT